jgi:pyruvate,water dikinase
VVRCWSSLWTARAISYRAQTGYADTVVAMSVGVQKMVRPIASGVAFTLNPINGDRSQVAIDASWGLGEPVVSGEVTPDNYLVDKVLFEITSRRVSNKTVELRVEGDAIERVALAGERATAPCLTDAEIKAVARLARHAERHYGCPQDIEWALDSELPSLDNVVLLQSRPETVWSRQPRQPVATSTDVMDSIVSTLCAPIHTRPQSAT